MQAIAACRSGARCRAIDVLLINPDRASEGWQRIRHRRASSSVRGPPQQAGAQEGQSYAVASAPGSPGIVRVASSYRSWLLGLLFWVANGWHAPNK